MVWQDTLISIANMLFTYSLAYQVMYGFFKKKGFVTLTTSGVTTAGMYAMTVCFFTLGLYFSAIVGAINSTLWLLLFIQRAMYKKA